MEWIELIIDIVEALIEAISSSPKTALITIGIIAIIIIGVVLIF